MQLTVLHLPLQLILCAVSCLYATVTYAQVTPDNTLGTQVDRNGNVSEITGGETRGSNLFHSFQDFSVQAGNEAFFNNASNISTVFSRVTGVNVSEIDGLIRANGSADLFLINPNGIIFGENAQLSIGGSFLGSTADSILFDEGEFSATDLDTPPLLTIKQPIGLGLPDNPAEIVNRSTAPDSQANSVGLEVIGGNHLSLVGGDIRFEGGKVTASGGNVELGGLSQAGTVGISEDGSLTWTQDAAKADVILSDGAVVDVEGRGGGNITVNARNLDLTARSFLDAGINQDSTSEDAQAGDIAIDVSDRLTLDRSRIRNLVNGGGVGNSGKIDITTDSLEATNGGRISSSTFIGQGNAGGIDIDATGDVTFSGNDGVDPSGAFSLVVAGAEGNGGDINISTANLTLEDGGEVNASTFGRGDAGSISISTGNLTLINEGLIDASTSGQGNAGLVQINANDTISIDGERSDGSSSRISSRVDPGGVGNAEGVTILTDSLTVTGGGYIDASTFGQGNAGLVQINASNVTFEGTNSENDYPSSAFSQVNQGGQGNSEGVTISAENLTLTDGGLVSANTFGQGNAGNININVTEMLFVDSSLIVSEIRSNSNIEANGGDINLTTESFSLTNGSLVSTNSFGQGDSGNISINATGTVSVIEGASLNSNIASGAKGQAGNIVIKANDVVFDGGFARSRLEADAEGSGGNINITTGSLLVTGISPEVAENNIGQLVTATFGRGDAGSLTIDAIEDVSFDGRGSDVFSLVGGNLDNPTPPAEGNAGNITINSGSLSVKNQARLVSSVEGIGKAGNININTNSLSIFNEGQILTDVANTGIADAGNIEIVAESVDITNRGRLSASTALTGNGGNLILEIADLLLLRNNSNISTTAGIEGAGGNGGNIEINADFVLAFPLKNSDITANAFEGNGGNIDIEAQGVFGIEERQAAEGNITNDIDASSEFGLSGTVEINILQVDPSQDSLDILDAPVETEVAQICEPSRDGDRDEFIVTGRGGLPDSPQTNLNGDFGLEDWRIGEAENVQSSSNSDGNSLKVEDENPKPIVEARGWIVNDRGKVELVADNASHTNNEIAQRAVVCQTN